jgi:hypothetical protein
MLFGSLHPSAGFGILFVFSLYTCQVRDSVVCIATRYELDGPGIESR